MLKNNDASSPPAKPSNVLFGLIFLTIYVSPNFEPMMKADVSNSAVLKIINPYEKYISNALKPSDIPNDIKYIDQKPKFKINKKPKKILLNLFLIHSTIASKHMIEINIENIQILANKIVATIGKIITIEVNILFNKFILYPSSKPSTHFFKII